MRTVGHWPWIVVLMLGTSFLFGAVAPAWGQQPTTVEREVAKLVKQLNSGDTFEQRDAARALSRISPKQISNKGLRKEVARAFKNLVEEKATPEGVRGLWVWGGKYSVPLLIDVLEKSGRTSVPDGLLQTLGETKDARAARAIATKVGDFFTGDEAAMALRNMGPIAEEALIEVAPSSDADVALAAVALLAECGTEASYPLLRKAMKSRNRQVREVAKRSLARIRDRLRNGDAAIASNDNSDSPFEMPSGPSASDEILNAVETESPHEVADSNPSFPGSEPTVPQSSGDWSDVRIVMSSTGSAAGVPADPAPAIEGEIKLQPITLAHRQHGDPFGHGNMKLARFAYGFLLRFGMANGDRPLAVVAHPRAEGVISDLEVVDLLRGKSVATSPGPGGVLTVGVAPGCRRAVTASAEGSFHETRFRLAIWDVSTAGLKEVTSWIPYSVDNNPWKNEIRFLQWADGERLFTVNGEGELVCWEADKAKAIYQMQLGRQNNVPAISPGGKYFATVDRTGVNIFATGDGASLAHLDSKGVWGTLAFNRTGTRLACHGGQFVWVWNLADGRMEKEIYGINMSSRAGISWLDDDHVLVGSMDVVDLNRNLVSWRYEAHRSPAFNFQGKTWYLLQSGSQFGLVPYDLPHHAALQAVEKIGNPHFILAPGDGAGLELQLHGNMREAAGDLLQDELEKSGLNRDDAAKHKFMVLTTTDSEEAYYERIGGFDREVTKVNVQKEVYQVKLEVDGKLAFEFRSTQAPPLFVDMEGDESIQQAVNRETRPEAKFFAGCRIPSHIIHPDQAGPHGTSKITPHGLK